MVIHQYTPTSLGEFPREGQGYTLRKGIYDVRDILYFARNVTATHCSANENENENGVNECTTHRVHKLMIGDGVLVAYISHAPFDNSNNNININKNKSSMHLGGPYGYLKDSINNNLNIKVRSVGRFTLRSAATPILLMLILLLLLSKGACQFWASEL